MSCTGYPNHGTGAYYNTIDEKANHKIALTSSTDRTEHPTASTSHYYNPYNRSSSSTTANSATGADHTTSSAVNYRMTSKGRYEQDQRAALFGTLGGRGASTSAVRGGAGSRGGVATMATAAALEAENDDRVQDLAARVGDLKDISLKMRDEVVESNKNLSGMSSQFDTVGGFLGNTMKRLTALGQSGTTRHIWLMMLFVVGMLFLMYLFYKRK